MEIKYEQQAIYYGKCPKCGRAQKSNVSSSVDTLCHVCFSIRQRESKIEQLNATKLVEDSDISIEMVSDIYGNEIVIYSDYKLTLTGKSGQKYIIRVPDYEYPNLHIDIVEE